MVPTKNGPKIRLKSLITFISSPPLTVHHLNGIANILSITTINDANVATGVYFLNSFLGIKKTVNQDYNSNPSLIIVANICNTPSLFLLCCVKQVVIYIYLIVNDVSQFDSNVK